MDVPVALGQPRAVPALLEATVSRRFGRLDAVRDVHIALHPREIVGLIGANGAGKTTLLNILSGIVRPSTGTVSVDGVRQQTSGPGRRARSGIARTFQHPRLVPALTAVENVMLGARRLRFGNRERDLAAVAVEALRATGVDEQRWLTRAAEIPPADHRWIEFARVLAGCPRVALLDEPSSGFTEGEVDRLASLITSLARERGVGVLLVTHDVGLAVRVSDRVHVLDHGHTLAEGTAREVIESDVVRAAYLGDATVERLRRADRWRPDDA